MSNQLSHSNIPTTWPFGKKRGFTWNPVRGCANYTCPLHPKNKGKCWAAALCHRFAYEWADKYFDTTTGNVKPLESCVEKLRNFIPVWLDSQYNKKFPIEQSCIAVGYQTDLAFVPREWVDRILEKIKINNQEREAAGLPLHVFQFLTKAPGKLYPLFEWPKNCWLGFTAMNQDEFISRISDIHNNFSAVIKEGISLLATPFYVYLEPLESEIKINMTPGIFEKNWIKWVIVGGGPNPLNPDWIRSIRDQYLAVGIPFFFKGWGDYEQDAAFNHPGFENVIHKRIRFKKGAITRREKLITLDGQKWEQFPEVKNA